ncbi:acyl-CoA thioesterase [Agromyces mangrovi Wang et al. 2018]|uniref:acyl-CoA thioesterase n=1 Tax=Agromyces mangrovi TaxID=1858653 RepID=UPI002573B9B3|nr:thioesterase family protein [Agromyces mangrovi]
MSAERPARAGTTTGERMPRPADYGHLASFPTRWNDNDVYGHVNNVVYYAAMDSAVNAWMIARGLDIEQGDAIALVVSSSCDYHASGAYPDVLEVGVRIGRLGTSSVTWETGIFRASDAELLATGKFVHVFVGRESRRPTPVPAALRAAMERELVAPAESP